MLRRLRKEIAKQMDCAVNINIEEIRKPDLDATLVAQNVAQQLERRVMFRRAMKRAVQNAMRGGALGVKIQVGGRLGGAEIARLNGIEKDEFRFTHCELILTIQLPKVIPLMELSV